MNKKSEAIGELHLSASLFDIH
jgi:hypothetical protein